MLSSGLYYPHTQLDMDRPGAERLLKRSLLLWDRLEFIVPTDDYHSEYADNAVREAIDIIGKNRIPSEDEKQEAHGRIEELVTRPGLPPEAFLYTGNETYEVYPQKFLPDTWDLLRQSKFAGQLLPNGDYPTNPQVGLTIMAILADCCAGTTRSRVTDRAQAYAGLTAALRDHGDDSSFFDRTVDATLSLVHPNESLVSLRLSLLNIDLISLEELINFRKREEAESGDTLRDLRHKYVQSIEDQVNEVRARDDDAKELSDSDIAELERCFAQKNEDDVKQLKRELRLESVQGLLSRDVVVTLLGISGLAASAIYPPAAALHGVLTAAGVPAALGGMVAARSKYLKARSDVLRKHPMAFLYELGNS